MCQKMKPPSYVTHKNKLKWIKNLNVKTQNHKYPRKKVSKISGIVGSIFPP